MIGSLLFYALYPLSRYLTRRPSADRSWQRLREFRSLLTEQVSGHLLAPPVWSVWFSKDASEQGLPPAALNGSAESDGGTVTTRRLIQSQTTPPDRRLGPRHESKGETEERVKVSSPKLEDDTRPDMDKELPIAVPHEDTNDGAASKVSEVQSAAEEKETDQRQVEAPTHEDGGRNIHCTMLHQKQDAEDGSSFPTEDDGPALGAQLKSPQTDDSIQEATCSVLEQIQIQTSEESGSLAEDNQQKITCSAEEQIQIQTSEESGSLTEDNQQKITCSAEEQIQIQTSEESGSLTEDNQQKITCSAEEQIQIQTMEKSQAPVETTAEVFECLDEFRVPTADTSKFVSVIFPTHPKLSKKHDDRHVWHFPAGPGLAEEVQCLRWDCPAISYYPPVELTEPFEVMWRIWEDLAESTPTPFPVAKTSIDFTVMSYNILAQDQLEANQDLCIHCPQEVMDWNCRCSLLLEEIQTWGPDILCLQEVQENHYREQLHPALCQMGYTCVYKRRTGTKTDGCATCYRSSCFSEVALTQLEYFRPETELLDRHNVGIVLLLQPVVTQGSEVKKKGPPLCVANTHLLFNPSRGDIKLTQLAIMLAEINSMIESCEVKGERCNIILCGDFNSVPRMGLYQLIMNSRLFYKNVPAWMISGQDELSYKNNRRRLSSPLWPSSLEITNTCKYATDNKAAPVSQSQSQSPKPGNCKYNLDFMLRLRYCPAACVRPQDLILLSGVTDNTSDDSKENPPYERLRHTISHRLDLESVYKHTLPGSGRPEVTKLTSHGGNTVDYIFYSPKRSIYDRKAGGVVANEGLKLIGALSLLSEDVLWSMDGLPNHIFPSDHLSLVAKFQLDILE